MCERGSVGICCHDSPDAEVFDPPVRAFHTVSLRTPVNKRRIPEECPGKGRLWR
jgi:hypothetical protein